MSIQLAIKGCNKSLHKLVYSRVLYPIPSVTEYTVLKIIFSVSHCITVYPDHFVNLFLYTTLLKNTGKKEKKIVPNNF